MKRTVDKSEVSILRQTAEALLKKKAARERTQFSESEVLKLVHELEVHQIELEMQNDELIRSREREAELATEKYVELYDFAPSGYFTLTKEGRIVDLNLNGARMLGKERSQLKNTNLGFYISSDTQSKFIAFLAKIFSSPNKGTCEVNLSVAGDLPVFVHLSGIVTQNKELCLITMVDFTEVRKLTELNEILLSSLPHPAMYIRKKDKVVLAVNRIAADLGVKVGGYCWRDFMKEENISPKDKTVLKGYPGFVPAELDIKCCFCLGDKCFTDSPEQNDKLVHSRGLIWDTYWIKVSDDILLHYAIDITDRQKKDDALRKSEENNKALLNANPDMMFVLDENGVFIDFHVNNNQYLYASADDFIGKKVSEVLPPEVAKKTTYFLDQVLKTGQMQVYTYQLNVNHAWRDYEGRLVLCGNSNALSIVRDITLRKKTQQALQKSVEQFDLAMELTNDGLWDWDIASGNMYYSPGYFRILGYEPGDFKSHVDSWLEMTHPDDLNCAITIKDDCVNNISQSIKMEYRMKAKDGTWRWILSRGKAVRRDENGKALRMIGTHVDITESKLIEEKLMIAKEKAEGSDRLKSAFLANMSHEIRTPMSGILGFAELLKQPGLTSEQQRKYINIIEKSGTRMLKIINDIIDISKIESGQMQVSISKINVNEQIEYIYSSFKEEAEQKGMKILFKNSLSEEKAVIKTDREKFYAILTNLVNNAIKYSDEGTIEFGYVLKSKSNASASEPNELEFYVSDSGIGIPEDRKAAIFERFIQADVDDKKAFQGAGLGLAISKAFIEMLGGRLWVESNSGKGSVFYFTLPYKVVQKGKTIPKHEIPIEINERDPNSKLKILVAEDDEFSEMLITIAVERFYSELQIVKSGHEAVEACRNTPELDLILMDIKMPGMDGYEAIRQIRHFNKNVIIVVQTAYGLRDREKAMESGCNDYISKPYSIGSLTALIKKYFSHHSVSS
ncbi:MAG: PAS domain-containing protein [Bacteroidota bacterium]|nr:PAS domain-containing protein [Bacteroidota bacterium]